MHRFLVPPEALEPTEADAPPTTREPLRWTVNDIATTSLLAVILSATASVTYELAPVIVPCTLLLAYGFWHVGRRITRPGGMWLYCLGGGAVAGAVNAWLVLYLSSIFFPGRVHLSGEALRLEGLAGAVIGFAYGFAYLLPMLSQLSARSLRRAEGIDRCLVGYGLWGVLFMGLEFRVVAVDQEEMHAVGFVFAAATLVLHGLMALAGTGRWARRRSWLARVAQGKASGWQVCDARRFHAAELERLQLFSPPLFARPPANRLRVLAYGYGTDAYRSTPPTPKYLVY